MSIQYERSTEWRNHAACKDTDPNIMVPPKNAADKRAQAKAICATCTVQEPCLAYAIATDSIGIWAGTTGDDRRRRGGVARVAKPRRRPPLAPINHGTVGGNLAHRRRDEMPVCQPCKDAWNADRAARRAAGAA